MTSPGDIWDAAPWPPRWIVRHVRETGSTNADLLAAARDGFATDRTVLVTDHQTAGRGRLDRRWDAPPGTNALVSLLFTPVPDRPGELTQRVAVAAAVAAETLVPGLDVGLKWPNDLVVDDGKIGGILAQRADDVVVVGLGFNIGWAPEGAADLGGLVTPPQFVAALLAAIDALPDEIGQEYRRRLVTLGRAVRAELPGGAVLDGVASDVDGAGRLEVTDAAEQRHLLDVGDIVHLRPGA